MPEDGKRTTERGRRQEEKMIEEAKRGPTAVGQAGGKRRGQRTRDADGRQG